MNVSTTNAKQIIRSTGTRVLFKRIIHDWALKTTAHAFGNIARSRYLILGLIWIACLLASTTYCFYVIIKTIIQYNNFEVNTRLELVYETPTQFPAVTICNLNSFNAEYSKEEINEVLTVKGIFENTSKPIDYVEYSTLQFKAPFNDDEVVIENRLIYFGYFLGEMLADCKFQGETCDYNDFNLTVDYHYGNCYTFNSDPKKPKTWKKPGDTNGLRLELFTGNINTQQVYTFRTGIKVIIHNQSSNPFFEEEGIEVPVGHFTNIGLSRTVLNRLSEPYSNCIENSNQKSHYETNSFFRYLWDNYNFTQYTLKYCMKACLQLHIFEKCNCYDTKLVKPIVKKGRFCIDTEQVNCAKQIDDEFHSDNGEILDCYSKCPNECNKVIYHTEINTAKYPTFWYSKQIETSQSYMNIVNSSDFNYLERSALVINVFYDRNYYLSIDESTSMSFEDLLANIGNNLGLFLGMSVLSLVEIFEIFMFISVIMVTKFINRNQVNDTNQSQMNKA